MMLAQHRMRSFLHRFYNTQVPPVMLYLADTVIIVVFIPIFDRFVSFDFGVYCHDSIFQCSSARWLLLWWFTLRCLMQYYIQKLTQKVIALGNSFWFYFWRDLYFARVLCTNMSQKLSSTTQGLYTLPSRTVGLAAVFRRLKRLQLALKICSCMHVPQEWSNACRSQSQLRIIHMHIAHTPHVFNM